MRQILWLVMCSMLFTEPLLAQAETHSTELSLFKGTYRDLDSLLEPVRQGGLEIRVSSPRHRLTIYENRVDLRPTTQGTFHLNFRAEFDGEGHLIAEVHVPGGSPQRFTDDVVARRQTVRVRGEISLEAHERGFLVTVEEAPSAAGLRIESALIRQLVGVCNLLSLMPVVRVDCQALGESLGTIRVPMPEEGEQFVLPSEALTDEERRFFEGLLSPAS